MIKSVRRFTVSMGKTTIGGVQYWTWGSATSISSTDYTLQIYSSDGPVAKFCFVSFPVPFDPNKSFLTWSFTGHGASTRQNARVRICGTNGYPPSTCTSFTQIQITQFENFRVSTHAGTVPNENPSIDVELVEFY